MMNRIEDEDDEIDAEDWGATWCNLEEPVALATTEEPDISGKTLEEMKPHTVKVKLSLKPEVISTSSVNSFRMLLNDNKAGMDGLDKERINAIILAATKGSNFHESQLKKEAQLNVRIEEQQRKLSQLTPQMIQQAIIQTDRQVAALEASRDLTRTIVHVDMDAFFAAVEMRDNPALRDVPMAVGGSAMLSTSNYLARRYGVRAAMPGFIAKKLCPHLIIVPANYEKYVTASDAFKEILAEYDPEFCTMSLDEAYLDFTDHLEKRTSYSEEHRTFSVCECVSGDVMERHGDVTEGTSQCDAHLGLSSTHTENAESVCKNCWHQANSSEVRTFGTSAEEAVDEMRFRIKRRTQLTASAGIAPNSMLAKVCSDYNKPDGQCRVQPTVDAVKSFIQDMPLKRICGIGKVTEAMLSSLGVVTCSDLCAKRGVLYHLFSPTSIDHFLQIATGCGSNQLSRERERKSISVERTFSEISRPAELYKKCYELSDHMSEDLKAQSLVGKTVSLKIKTVTFDVRIKSQTVGCAMTDTEQIYRIARDLLRKEIQAVAPSNLCLRLMGVKMSNLEAADGNSDKRETIDGFFSKASCTDDFTQSNEPSVNTTGVAVKTKHKSCEFVCPVCNVQQSTMSIVEFNKHLDMCLAGCEQSCMTDDNHSTVTANPEQCQSNVDGDDDSCRSETSKHGCIDPVAEMQSIMTGAPVPSSALCSVMRSDSTQKQDDACGSSANIRSCATDSIPAIADQSNALPCPMCGVVCMDLSRLNDHIDSCLTRRTIRDILQTDKDNTLSRIHSSSSSSEPPAAKRRKITSSTKHISIENFFK